MSDVQQALAERVELEKSAYPESVKDILEQRYQQLKDLDDELIVSLLDDFAPLCRAFAVSDFLAEVILRHPVEFLSWKRAGFKEATPSYRELQSQLDRALAACESEEDLIVGLRQFRRQHMFAIVWRDLVERVAYRETVAYVSALACCCIDSALNWLHRQMVQDFGEPCSRNGIPQKMVVLGMGKLGAGELNVSSDIDLIFTFPEHGETQGGKRSTDNQNFFTRLGQKLIQALDKMTADGFVFRVDMRLRPYGQSGALALSFAAMEEYYEDQGRDWERYAMIKAAPVAGDLKEGERLMTLLRPFIYRKYIDFGAIDSLRSMKEMIEREVLRKGIGHNIKLGSGGIREIEFIAQVFQLIRGGRDTRLQQRNLLRVLEVIREDGHMPAEAVAELTDAYVFLRDMEHAIQGLEDRQTQQIPDDEVGRLRVAIALGFGQWSECAEKLQQHRDNVSRHFAGVIAAPRQVDRKEDDSKVWTLIWQGELTDEERTELLEEVGCAEPGAYNDLIRGLQAEPRIQHLQAQGKERLTLFMPRLLSLAVSQNQSPETLSRLFGFVEAVARRSAYLSLLNENPRAFEELVRLFGESLWVAEQISRMPLLLDELLHAESLFTPPDTATLSDELRQEMLRIPQDDLEEQMEVLRYFKRAHLLRVAASDIRGTMPLMKVSDYLTYIAETILSQVLDLAWNTMVSKHGRPMKDEVTPCNPDFAVVGYGKLGGIELSYGSDLDLVFVHDGAAELATDGDQSIDNQVFFTRLGQRIIHLLNTKTASGDLYEVDMRLRPSGNSGLLVSSVDSWLRYQKEKAWTWEHQALVRARCVAGDEVVREKFDAARLEVLTTRRDQRALKEDVLAMREKMRDALATRPDSEGNLPHFDLKHDPGGIVDIEFMVQYAALRWAPDHPSVVRFSDNIRILESLSDAKVLDRDVCDRLCEIYRQLRARGHRLALQNQPTRVGAEEFVSERQWVQSCWSDLFEA